jgi:hypothetical protein
MWHATPDQHTEADQAAMWRDQAADEAAHDEPLTVPLSPVMVANELLTAHTSRRRQAGAATLAAILRPLLALKVARIHKRGVYTGAERATVAMLTAHTQVLMQRGIVRVELKG